MFLSVKRNQTNIVLIPSSWYHVKEGGAGGKEKITNSVHEIKMIFKDILQVMQESLVATLYLITLNAPDS